MSAFDVAGAAVWTLLAASLWAGMLGPDWTNKSTDSEVTSTFICTLIVTLAAVFCIARLFGAHL